MWDNIQANTASADRPAVTVYTVASRGERHTTRHTRSLTGGVRTTRLGAVQRRVLMTVLKLARDTAFGTKRHEVEIWVPWRPEAIMSPERTPTERVAVSKALATLHKRRLLMVRRHKGGRAHAVRLTEPGHDLARELYDNGGLTLEQKRRRLAESLQAEIRRAVPAAYRELRSSGLGDDRRAKLERFVRLYSRWIGDPDAMPLSGKAPGFDATSGVLRELVEAFADIGY